MPRALSLIILFLPTALHAIEPWADRAQPVRDGLVLWLDASRQPEARKANDLPPLATNAITGVCFDSSGNRLHLVQRLQSAQPRFVHAGKHAALRFDGKAAHLGLANVRKSLDDFTLFLVAAPRSNAG